MRQRLSRGVIAAPNVQGLSGGNVRRGRPRDLARQRGPETPNATLQPQVNSNTRPPTNRSASGLPAQRLGPNRTVARGGVLRNPAFANPSARDPAARALARATFRGRFVDRAPQFIDRRWRGHPRGVVIGWAGPVFWPYAYYDFVDYTFWPYAEDTFWPRAYDDVYEGIFGPYAFAGNVYANVPSGRRGGARARVPQAAVAQICAEQASGLTDWPIERIAQVVEPDDTQRAALEDLKSATARAVELLQSACPSDLPSTPTGRLTAMRQRLETMLEAVRIIRPALDKFYQSLNDEQKARFNAIGPEDRLARQGRAATRQGPDLTLVCGGQATTISELPMPRIERALRPTEAQRAALEDLHQASFKAADMLKANCSEDPTLTPPGRLEAMQTRLETMLQALTTVQPALERFYNSLTDEQKARFNQLGTRQG